MNLRKLFSRKSQPQLSKNFTARLAAAKSQPGETFPLPGVPGARGRTPNPPVAQREPKPEAVALLARLVSTITEDELSQLKELNSAWPGLTLNKIVSMAELEASRRPSGATKAADTTAKPAAVKPMTFAESRSAGIIVLQPGETLPNYTEEFFRACGRTNGPSSTVTAESQAISAAYSKAIEAPPKANYVHVETKARMHETIPVRQIERFGASVWI